MLSSKITPTLASRFVPESLLGLLKPGRVFTAKVETLAGRLLTLWVGGERLEALLSDNLSPTLFRPGQRIRLKVADLGPPLVLSLIPQTSAEERPEKVFPRLLQSLALERSKARGKVEAPPGRKPLEDFRHLFLEKGALESLREDVSSPLKRELRETLLHFWNEGRFVLPFLFGERILWSYLYEESPSEGRSLEERYFVLEIFLNKLGFLAVHFRLTGGVLTLSLCFAREESLALARKELTSLEESLSGRWPRVLIKCEMLGVPPGILLAKEA